MKIIKFATLLLALSIMFNCSSSDADENPDTSNPVVVEKDLLKMTGDADHWLNYQNDKINKAWSSSTTFRSQMVFNPDGNPLINSIALAVVAALIISCSVNLPSLA